MSTKIIYTKISEYKSLNYNTKKTGAICPGFFVLCQEIIFCVLVWDQ